MTNSESPRPDAIPKASSELGPLWYFLARREWRTLAVVSADDDDAALRLARALVELAGAHHAVLEVRDTVELRQKLRLATRLETKEGGAAVGRPWRFLVPMKAVLEDPHAEDILAACDVVVLLLEKGKSRIPDALSAVGLVGRERLLGAVLASA